MTLRVLPTFGEIRSSVQTRAAVGDSTDFQPIIDEMIRSSHNELWVRFAWARQDATYTFALVDGQTDYDIPDGWEAQSVQTIYLRGADGYNYPLEWSVDPGIRNLYSVNPVENGQPRYIEWLDGVLRFTPPPDATNYPTVYMIGQPQPGRLVNENDRIAVDEECLVRLATIRVLERLGTADTRAMRADFDAYCIAARANQRPAQSFDIASRRGYPNGFAPGAYNPMLVPYTNAWHPWID